MRTLRFFRLFHRVGLKNRANKKKKRGFLFISTNRTFYVTFILSILCHIGLIYMIPAVDVFSEGSEETDSELILVDVLEEQSSEMDAVAAPADIPQFQTDVPPAAQEQPIEETPPETEPEQEEIDTDLSPLEKITELENDYTLLSQTVTSEPEIFMPSMQKRSLQNLPEPPLNPQKIQTEKLTAPQKRPGVILAQPRFEVEKPLKIAPVIPDRPLPDREPEEETLPQLPLSFRQQEKAQVSDLEALPEKPSGMGKRSLTEKIEAAPPVLPDVVVNSPIAQKRQFGIAKQRENDKNQFGIFAGRAFDEPVIKEEMQEIVTQKEEQNVADVTETATNLSTESQIEGPVKGRAVIYRPRLPQIGNIDTEVELQLKFWVLPDGTIGDVIPVKRGNTELEQIAIAYLKKWLFEPLATDVPQQKIWGTIPIKFTVE